LNDYCVVSAVGNRRKYAVNRMTGRPGIRTLAAVELIVCFVGLCVAAVLAMRFGVDSRTPPPSKEQDLADLGLTWPAIAPIESNR
jgi:hypothetical protein